MNDPIVYVVHIHDKMNEVVKEYERTKVVNVENWNVYVRIRYPTGSADQGQ
jgi:hypothetical protein